jgi:hypothetical protein
MPALEVGELAGHDPVSPDRVAAWLRVAPTVGSHQFIKLHAHGAPEKNAAPLLERDLAGTLGLLREACSQRQLTLVHATAWEAAQAVEQLSRGESPRLR